MVKGCFDVDFWKVTNHWSEKHINVPKTREKLAKKYLI